MTDFSLTHLGDGAFELCGQLDLSNVVKALSAGQSTFKHHENISIDVSEADCASTVGMALLLEWSTWSIANEKHISYTNVPARLIDLVNLNDVSDLMQFSSE